MKNNTMYILGGVALVGVAYYLYTKNKPSTTSSTSSFSNLTGKPMVNSGEKGTCCTGFGCPAGYTCATLSFDGGKTVVCRCVAS